MPPRQTQTRSDPPRNFRRLPARLVAVSWRDLLVIALPVLAVTAAAALGAAAAA